MRYLCMAYEQERVLNELTREEWSVLREETLAYVQELREKGVLLAAEPLQSAKYAATVRIRGGALSVTDGPFAETRETLGGYFLVEARDLNEAVRIASGWPSARIGSIEVRPVADRLNEERRYEE